MSNYLNPMSTIRFGGLASGIDTESMIRDMMRIEHMKVDRIKQDRQLVEWRRDAYREMTNKLRAFKDEFFDIVKPANYMLSPNTYKNHKVSISGGEGILSASTNADAVPGMYKVKVSKLAEPAKIVGEQLETEDLDINPNTKLSELLKSELDGEDFKIKINGTDIELDKDMTIRDVMNEIRSNEDANAQLTYSSITGRFVLESKDTGSEAKLKIDLSEGRKFWEEIGLISRNDGNNYIEASGQNAEIEVNIDNEEGEDGLKYYAIESSTNTFTRDGITFNLYDITDDSYATINITEDIDASFEKIKKFVDSYNELIAEINAKMTEKQHRDFPPLTDEQREAMSEKDIELWEEKAMSGLLRKDPILQKMVYSMRSALSDGIEGIDGGLSDIGITTGKWYEHGRLYVDEHKLKKALAENPDRIMELFTKTDGSSYNPDMDAGQRSQRYRNIGVIRRISDILEDNIRTSRNKNNKKGALLERAGIVGDTTEFQNVMDNQIKDIDKQIDRMTDMLIQKEESYWRQFTAMERAIQDMHAQSAWLAQQLNSGI